MGAAQSFDVIISVRVVGAGYIISPFSYYSSIIDRNRKLLRGNIESYHKNLITSVSELKNEADKKLIITETSPAPDPIIIVVYAKAVKPGTDIVAPYIISGPKPASASDAPLSTNLEAVLNILRSYKQFPFVNNQANSTPIVFEIIGEAAPLEIKIQAGRGYVETNTNLTTVVQKFLEVVFFPKTEFANITYKTVPDY
jgi:hypothetical protein